GRLTPSTDAAGNVTTFVRDAQNRVTAKKYADGTEQDFVYEAATSRVHSVTDALKQLTVFTYNTDGTLAAMEHMNAAHPTPPVKFTYDSAYARPISMQDATGTTGFQYHPVSSPPVLGAGQLAAVS